MDVIDIILHIITERERDTRRGCDSAFVRRVIPY